MCTLKLLVWALMKIERNDCSVYPYKRRWRLCLKTIVWQECTKSVDDTSAHVVNVVRDGSVYKSNALFMSQV